MKSKARRAIERSISQNLSGPKMYVADGKVFLYPSASGATHHVVAWMRRYTAKRSYEEFVCSCKGFWYSHDDDCWHIRDLKEQIRRTA